MFSIKEKAAEINKDLRRHKQKRTPFNRVSLHLTEAQNLLSEMSFENSYIVKDILHSVTELLLEAEEKALYQKGEFCKFIKCENYAELMKGNKENCLSCKAFQFHDYLQKNYKPLIRK